MNKKSGHVETNGDNAPQTKGMLLNTLYLRL